MPNLVTGHWHDEFPVVLVVHNANPPSDDEWDAYCQNVASQIADSRTVGIALTDGGAPNSAQRDRMRITLGARKPRSAVISRSILVRGVVTALSWFNPETVAFSPEQLGAAFAFAGIRNSQAMQLLAAISALDLQLTPRSRVVADIQSTRATQ